VLSCVGRGLCDGLITLQRSPAACLNEIKKPQMALCSTYELQELIIIVVIINNNYNLKKQKELYCNDQCLLVGNNVRAIMSIAD
jgi:hypothetical protein